MAKLVVGLGVGLSCHGAEFLLLYRWGVVAEVVCQLKEFKQWIIKKFRRGKGKLYISYMKLKRCGNR